MQEALPLEVFFLCTRSGTARWEDKTQSRSFLLDEGGGGWASPDVCLKVFRSLYSGMCNSLHKGTCTN